MAEDQSGGLGIRPGLSEPYENDEPTPDDELMSMFADESEDDRVEVDTEREPVDEVPEAPASPPVIGDGGAAPEVESGGSEPPAPAALEGETPEEARQRFADQAEAERSYRELQRAFTQVAQDNQQRQREQEEMRTYLEAQQEQFDELVRVLQAKEAEDDPEFAERLTRQQEIDRLVEERMAPFAEQAEQVQQREADALRQSQAAVAVRDFYAKHTDVVPQSPADLAMARAFQNLKTAGVPLDIRRPEHLEVALEASRDPNFAAELSMQPQALQIPDGLARIRARSGATIAATNGTPSEGTLPNGRAPARKRLEAHVEVGSGGAPVDTAPGQQTDEFDEAEKWYREDFRKGPLFGAQRA